MTWFFKSNSYIVILNKDVKSFYINSFYYWLQTEVEKQNIKRKETKMRKKLFHPKTIIMSALVMTLTFGNCVYAGVSQSGSDVKFTKHFIDSLVYKEVASGTKINAGKVLNMQVTYMYDDNGNLSDTFEKSKWKVYRVNGSATTSFSDEIVVKKGVYTGLTMDSKVTANDKLVVKAKGNNSNYDAKISGYLYNFTKQ